MTIVLLDAVTGLSAQFLKRFDKKMLPLVVAVTCSFVDEIVAYYFKIKFRNNLMVYYVAGPIEYGLLAWFLYLNIDNAFVKKAIKISIWIYVLVAIGYSVIYFKYAYNDFYAADQVSNYFIIFNGLLISIWCVCYFKNIFDRISNYEYLDIYVMLVVSAMLFYNAFSTVFFAAENYLTTQALNENANLMTDIYKLKLNAMTQAYRQLTDIQLFLYLTNLLFYLCILIAFCRNLFVAKEPVLADQTAFKAR